MTAVPTPHADLGVVHDRHGLPERPHGIPQGACGMPVATAPTRLVDGAADVGVTDTTCRRHRRPVRCAARLPVWPGRGVLGGVLTLALLSGCAGVSPSGKRSADGPPSGDEPRYVDSGEVTPRVEPIRAGGPNKPYEIGGRRYVPLAEDVPMRQTGIASWYGRQYHGRPTALGERFDMHAMTAAHPTMPLPSYARVRNPENAREIVVRVNDRGPFVEGRVIDLSYAAAMRLGIRGIAPVEVERLTFAQIRAGAGGAREDAPGAPVVVADLPRPDSVVAGPPATAGGFWLQLGAFRQAEGAQRLRDDAGVRFQPIAARLTVVRDGDLHRVRAGPYPSREAAQAEAERVHTAMQLMPLVLALDD